MTAPPTGHAHPYTPRQAVVVLSTMIVATIALDLVRLPLNLLAQPLRANFGISDVQFSLLIGAFASVPMLIMSLVGGWLSDHVARRRLLTVGLLIWTAGALLCVTAPSFEQLAMGRIVISIGAGMKLPVAMTWINDAFEPDRRGRAIGLFFIVLGTGPALAATLTGVIQHLGEQGAFDGWHGLGSIAPWRITLLLLAAPSLLLLPLLLRLPDIRTAPPAVPSPGVGGTTTAPRFPGGPLIAALIGGMALMVMLDSANLGWLPTLLQRRFGANAQEVGFQFGLVTLIAGTVGPLLGGFVGDRVYQRNGATGRVWLCAAAAAACAPLLLAYIGAPRTWLLVAVTLNGILTVTVLALGYVAIQSLLPPARRGFGTGVTNAVTTVTGASGPTAVALVSAQLLGGPASLGPAIALVTVVLAFTASAALALTAWSMGRASR